MTLQEIKIKLDSDVKAFPQGNIEERFEICKNHCIEEGLVLEFGVFSGGSIQNIESTFNQRVYGFDSWQGLPEDAEHVPKGVGGSYHKGAFQSNKPTHLTENITLIDGWFKDSLPPFLKKTPGNIKFLHVDSDQYISAKDIFINAQDRIVNGTVILFDEFMAHEGWEHREFLAFAELLHEHTMSYEVIFNWSNERVAFKIIRS